MNARYQERAIMGDGWTTHRNGREEIVAFLEKTLRRVVPLQ